MMKILDGPSPSSDHAQIMGEDIKPTLGAKEKLAWLRLNRSENVGPITFHRLLSRFGSAEAALEALPGLARRGGRRKIEICPKAAAEREMAAIAEAGATLIAHSEPDYPRLLARIEDAPPLITAIGHVHLLRKAAVAVVGARNASVNGRRFAATLARDLGKGGLMVVSGLARGIDTAAHEGALDTGTAAVMAGGVDVVYPAENRGLWEQIRDQGVAFSEMPPGTVPQARHFPRRNRLISGMARGVVVIEASPNSGSLITATKALDQGREVFAVPGSPLDPRARGTNDLLRQGAVLTESAADVIRVLSESYRDTASEPGPRDWEPAAGTVPDDAELDAARDAITGSLDPAPVAVDEVIRATGFRPAVVSTVLLELELAGRLERHPGNRVSLVA